MMKNKSIWITILSILIIFIIEVNIHFYLNNKYQEKLPEGNFNLCYYHIPGMCVPEKVGGCGRVWESLPLENPNSCKTDEDCLSSAPTYKEWGLGEVDCREDNRKGCFKDSDCALGGTCDWFDECFNKDYWTEYYNRNCKESREEEFPIELGYSCPNCKCINNYCREIKETRILSINDFGVIIREKTRDRMVVGKADKVVVSGSEINLTIPLDAEVEEIIVFGIDTILNIERGSNPKIIDNGTKTIIKYY